MLLKKKISISLLYCTAPLRNSDDILKTVELVSNGIVDSALLLVETSDYLWKEAGWFPSIIVSLKQAARQEEKWNQFKENKAVYTFWAHDLIELKCRINGRVGAHLMPATRSIDIDSLEDFIIAEAIAQSVNFRNLLGKTLSKSKKLISLVVRTKNEEFWIERFLKAVKSQVSSYSVEVILVDNNSNDETVSKALSSYEEIKVTSITKYIPGTALNLEFK